MMWEALIVLPFLIYGGMLLAIATQNRVNCTTVEPALTQNAEPGYVKKLFAQLNIAGGEENAG